jgi:hypothetical protein
LPFDETNVEGGATYTCSFDGAGITVTTLALHGRREVEDAVMIE